MKTGFDRFMELLLIYELLEAEKRYEEADELSKKISQIFLRVHEAMDSSSEDDYRAFCNEDDYKAFFCFDEFQRYESDKMISDIINNENYSTEYDEYCLHCEREYKERLKVLEETFGKKIIREYVISRVQNHEKHYKERLDDLARKLDKRIFRKYAKRMTRDKSIQMDTIITDMMIADNIIIYSSAKLKCIKDDWGDFFVKYMSYMSDEDESMDPMYPIIHYHTRHRFKTMSDVLNYMDAKIDYDNDLFNVEKAE